MQALATLAAGFPDLEFRLHFHEEGNGFAGDRVYRSGRLAQAQDYEPSACEDIEHDSDDGEESAAGGAVEEA